MGGLLAGSPPSEHSLIKISIYDDFFLLVIRMGGIGSTVASGYIDLRKLLLFEIKLQTDQRRWHSLNCRCPSSSSPKYNGTR